jgi:hypothetical protein
MTWNPLERPFRVIIYPPGGGYNVFNEKTETFATLAEALARVARITNPRFTFVIHEAQNPATWQQNGSWQLLSKGRGTPRKGGAACTTPGS